MWFVIVGSIWWKKFLSLMSKVSRMLVGGMKVIGVYVWVSDSAFKNSTITLFQVILAPCNLTIFPVLVCFNFT
jgi:hypothetical protein